MRQRLFLLSVMVLVGCSTIQVATDYDPAFDFTALRSFAWKPGPQEKTGDPLLDSSLLDDRVRRAVEEGLTARGFAQVPDADADFLVAYHVGVRGKTVVTSWEQPRTPGRTWERDVDVYEYDEGSLILDFLDPDGERLRWRGQARAHLVPGASPEEREARVREAVTQMLSEFPPDPG